MLEPIKKELKVKMAQDLPEKEKEPEKKETPKEELPIWNFPLQGKSIRARTLKEAQEKIGKL